MKVAERIELEVFLREDDSRATLEEIRAGLLADPKEISPRFFYDDRGSRLFEEICTLPEYYQTRTEAVILSRIADQVIQRTGASELVELGSGASTKTRILLDAMKRAGSLRRYVPVDVNEGILVRASRELVERYPDVEVRAVVADFMTDLALFPGGDERLCAFLGSTIGNFTLTQAAGFLADLGRKMRPGSYLLLGTDLIKDKARLEAAYNDSRGVTARFNKNVLPVLNRMLDGTFDPDAFAHVAFYNEPEHRIEMWLESTRAQQVELPVLDVSIHVDRGERIHTEISVKYDRDTVDAILGAGGYVLEAWYTDPEGLFALSLARKV